MRFAKPMLFLQGSSGGVEVPACSVQQGPGTGRWPGLNAWYLPLDDLRIDLALRRVQSSGETLHLTPTEFKLLARLVRSACRVVTHRQLLAAAWGPEFTRHTH